MNKLLVNWELIFTLIKKEFNSKYLGSYLGFIWAFAQPAITILIFWFVFQVGFKTLPVSDCPYILWLISGYIPWLFFAESITGATNSILDNSYLVKKIVFKVELLPVIKILSTLIVHLFFVLVVLLMFILYGFGFSFYYLQIAYYLFAMILLICGISYITSAVQIFFRDLGHIVSVCLQFAFWITPIIWALNILPKKYQLYIKLNPAFYIIEGYRNSLIHKIGFWHNIGYGIFFWGITVVLLVSGIMIFKRLRPHFSDVI